MAGATVLLVDERNTTLEAALQFHGFEVQTAATGRGALSAATGSSLDAVVLEVDLSDIDGFEVCRRLRSAGDTTPLVFLTGRTSVEDRVRDERPRCAPVDRGVRDRAPERPQRRSVQRIIDKSAPARDGDLPRTVRPWSSPRSSRRCRSRSRWASASPRRHPRGSRARSSTVSSSARLRECCTAVP